MANKYQVVDEILKNQGEGTYNVTFTNLNITDTENTESVEVVGAITDEVRSHLQLSYSDLEDAPGIPEEGIVNGAVQDFDKVAFTGAYNDLSGAPGIPEAGYNNGVVKDFNPIAFTGITDLGNVQVAAVLDLRSYSGGISTLGQDSAYVDTLPAGLGNAVGSFYDNFSQNKGKKPFFVITNAVAGGKVFSVLQVDKVGPGGPDGYYYYKIDVANMNSSIYPFVNGTEGTSVLDNIEITSQLGCFIFDLINNCSYYKTIDINANIDLSELAEVATSGDYDDLDNKPNLDASSQTSDISGLATVATSGDYDDLNNQYYIFTPGQFIHQYDSINDNWVTLTGDNLTIMQACGLTTGWIKNIHKLYKNESTEANNLIDELENLIDEFNNGKICYLCNFDSYKLIIDIQANYSDVLPNQLMNVSIYVVDQVYNNFNTALINQSVNSDSDIDNISNSIIYQIYKTIIVVDVNNKILYSLYQQLYPLHSIDHSLVISNKNELQVNLSSSQDNLLKLNNNDNEFAGLYVIAE